MITCVIPFYNESKTLIDLIDEISHIKDITQIICVDDGSINNLAQQIKKMFPKIMIKRISHTGKSEAVIKAIPYIRNSLVLLFDADLVNIRPREVEKAIKLYAEKKVEMLLLRITTKKPDLGFFFRTDIVLTGNRLIKTEDLKKVIRRYNPSGYQLETALNAYWMEKNKTTGWVPTSLINPNKMYKNGILSGLLVNMRVELSIVRYIGLINHLKQLAVFCRKRL